jgi:small subunit ribosomal protein S20
MANTKSAEKRIRQNEVRRERNRADRSRMRTEVKRIRTALAAGEVAKAEELLPTVLSTIDRTARKAVVHRNAAARTKSRLVKAVRAAKGA